MLVQKNNLNKRTKILLMIFGGILIAGIIYFSWQSLKDKSNKPDNLLMGNGSARTLTSVQSGINQEIFDNAQFLGLEQKQFDGFTDQYSGITLSDSQPIAISTAQVENPKTGERLVISWQLPEYINFDKVSIYRSSNSGFLGEQIYSVGVKDLEANKVMSYQDRDIENNKTYYYLIQSEIYNDDLSLSESSQGKQISGLATDEIAPASPDFVQVQGLSDGNIEISWFNPEDNDLDMIHIYRSTEKSKLGVNIYGVNSGEIGEIKVGSSMHYIIDSSVEKNLVYYYTVTSVDKSGNESSKDIVSASYKSFFYNPFEPIDF